MACCLFCARPLSKSVLGYCQLYQDHSEQTSVKCSAKYQTFHSQKCIWKYRLRNGGHFVQGEISELRYWSIAALLLDVNGQGGFVLAFSSLNSCIGHSALYNEIYDSWTMKIITQLAPSLLIGNVALVTVTETVIMSYHEVKSLQLMWMLGASKFHLQVSDHQMSCIYKMRGHSGSSSGCHAGLILGLCSANERHRCNVTLPLIGWAQT